MRKEKYDIIDTVYDQYVHESKDLVANLANISAILFELIVDINWLGFYLYNKKDETLILGPFQGRPAVDTISINDGVCGTCARKQTTILVDDVHNFCGHIACDVQSKSEIVVPVFDEGGNLFAIIDVDSPIKARFTVEEKELLEHVATRLSLIV